MTANVTKARRIRDPQSKRITTANRREAAVLGAMEVLAQRGARGLTHRQVDRHLHWPLGSTSNYFRTRNDIIIAIAEHIVNLDIEDLQLEPDLAVSAISFVSFSERIVHLLEKWMHPGYRNRMLVGAEILFETVRNREIMHAVRQKIGVNETCYQRVFKKLGSVDPIASAKLFSLMMSSMYVGVSVAKHLPESYQLRALVDSWIFIGLNRVGSIGADERLQDNANTISPMQAAD